jgi:adenylate cyclase
VSAEIQQAVAGAVDLKVLARSSSFQFRGADKAVRRVAEQTKATHVLDGSVRRSGTHVRVTTELVACTGETTLWSAKFDRDLTDVFALQDEIAAAVAAALKVAFAPLPAAGPIEPATYDLYLRTRDAAVPMDPAERVAKLRRVVDEAPRYAPARAWLAWWQGYYVVNMDHERPFAVDRDAARRDAEAALKLDPRSAVAYAALSWLAPMGHYAAREELLRKALAAAPHDALSLWNMAGFLDQVGRSLDALVYARRSYELDPLEPHAAGYVAGMYFRMGRYDEGQVLAEEYRQRWPGHWWFITPMIAFATHQGDWKRFEAMVELAKAAGLDRTAATRRTIIYGYAVRDNDRQFAERLVGDIERNLATRGAPRLDWLTAAQEFGLMDELFSAVDRADYLSLINDVGVNPGGDFPLAQIFDLTVNRAMIRDIRFVRLCAKLGLCDYWVKSDSWPDCAYQSPYDFKAEARRLAASEPALS